MRRPAGRCSHRRRSPTCAAAGSACLRRPRASTGSRSRAACARRPSRSTLAPSADALVAGLRDGRFEAGVTDKLSADQIAAREHWPADWLPGDLPRMPLAFGLWKGDLTLKRAVAGGLERLERNGAVAAVLVRYLRVKTEL